MFAKKTMRIKRHYDKSTEFHTLHKLSKQTLHAGNLLMAVSVPEVRDHTKLLVLALW